MKTKQQKLSKRLYEYRIEAGLTQQQVADLAGVDRKTVNRIENNRFSPSVDTIFRLCVTFTKKPSEVFEGL
jgi:DNA-binding XRE family transcriptional regulator